MVLAPVFLNTKNTSWFSPYITLCNAVNDWSKLAFIFKFVLKTWQEQIKHESRILQSLSNSSLKHTSAYMQLYNLTPKLFGKFCIQSLEGQWSLHSPFTPNFWIKHILLANHINTALHSFHTFLNYDCLIKTLSIL